MTTTLEAIEATVLAKRRRQAHKHRTDCASLATYDGDCRCEIDGVGVWCTRCGSKFSYAETSGVSGCPKCGTRGIPCAAIDDVQVKINWHELRILVIWAERWAHKSDEARAEALERGEPVGETMMPMVHAIARRLQEQHPSEDPLTFAGEMAELAQVCPGAEAHGLPQADETMLPPKLN